MAPYQKTNAGAVMETSLGRSLRHLLEKQTHSIKVVGLGRLELPTSRLSSARSNQLSYKPLTTNFLEKDRGIARCTRHKRPMISTSASPWRVFVREERET